tara:strand:- start:367 stop:1227 length:861 start_codon:yes stop_codon:yes gene_type:complete
MIIWLASYPKSGNTFLRSLLTSYLLTEDGKFDEKKLKEINQFPNLSLFKNIGIDTSDDLEIVKNYIKAQEKINSLDGNKIRFVKTHSSLNDINGYKFTDLKNTLGVIYVVRDPRSVVRSYANHNQLSLEDATNRLLEFGATIGGIKGSDFGSNQIVTHMGSWSSNYNTWKEFKKINSYLLVKYEDLVIDTKNTFLQVLNFIYKLGNSKLEINNSKLKNTIETTTFESMQKLEKQKGFTESVIDDNGKNIKFFKYGYKKNEKNILPQELQRKIENKLNIEMNELGYL